MRAPTVFLVDGDSAAREPLRRWLESAGHSVRAFESATQLLESWDPRAPGCLILELGLGDMSGLDLLEVLRDRGVAPPAIFLTAHADVATAVGAMRGGAFDFFEKPCRPSALLERVRQAIEQDRTVRAREAARSEQQRRLATLTPREVEVMDGMVAGRANKEIAETLGLSVRTVEGHRARLMDKLAASSLADVVRIRLGIEVMAPRP